MSMKTVDVVKVSAEIIEVLSRNGVPRGSVSEIFDAVEDSLDFAPCMTKAQRDLEWQRRERSKGPIIPMK